MEAGDVTKANKVCQLGASILMALHKNRTGWNKVGNRFVMTPLVKTQIDNDIEVFMFSLETAKN